MVSETRSRTMRAVKGKNTSPELKLRRLLHHQRYRFRLHRRDLPGNPDIVFPSRKKVIFVQGCFWHGHGCKRGARVPKSNTAYWLQKIEKNRARDLVSQTRLEELGWEALVIWECELKDETQALEKASAFLDDGY